MRLAGAAELTADVVVAGAGPAGIAAAVAIARRRPQLAAAGRIVCFDKARFPRDKPCGGGLTGHAHSALAALGLKVRVPAIPCTTGRIVYGGESRVVRLERPVDVVRRAEFDADLVAQARALGIRVVEDEAVVAHAVDQGRGLVRVETARGTTMDARVLIAADGAGSRIRQALVGRDPGRAQARPLRLFMSELAAPRAFAPEMIYDFSPMDEGLRGYVWLFPVAGGRLNVGAMHYPSRRLGGADVTRVLERALARHGVALSGARGWPAWPYRAGGRLVSAHVLCVGDAAGIDALTGEGIGVGLEHGLVAAEQIDRALETGDFSFSSYADELARGVGVRELTLDGRLARMLYASDFSSFWLSLVMYDRRVRELYAARVCGSEVLADRGAALAAAFVRHAVAAPVRMLRLARASGMTPASAEAGAPIAAPPTQLQ